MKINILHVLYIPTMSLLTDYLIPRYSNFPQRIPPYYFKTTCNTMVFFVGVFCCKTNKQTNKQTQGLKYVHVMNWSCRVKKRLLLFSSWKCPDYLWPCVWGTHFLHSYCSYL